MKRLRWLAVLMGITLAIITGFQVYWLNDNYNRENHALQIKTGVAFQETIQQLQAIKLKIPATFLRTLGGNESENLLLETAEDKKLDSSVHLRRDIIKTADLFHKKISVLQRDSGGKLPYFITIRGDSGNVLENMPLPPKMHDSAMRGKTVFIEEGFTREANGGEDHNRMITMIKTIHSGNKKSADSMAFDSFTSPNMVIRVRGNPLGPANATHQVTIKNPRGQKNFLRVSDSGRHAFNILYTVDSLQDSLHLPEINLAFAQTLTKQNIKIPFTISKLDSATFREARDLSEVTVGFATPVTYHLQLGNTAPYLFKKISLPILFSFFLAGVTIFSFVLLYRNLLRQQKLAEIKNEFISNMTHELKTPIATVGVAIEALKNFNAMHDPQKTREYLDISTNELQRLGLLVDKVLKLSMFEKRAVELSREYFDMKLLTSEVLGTMKLQFDKNRASVDFSTEGDRFIIHADKLHITSVIYNLLDNALKYRNSTPVITVKLVSGQNAVELIITDNGIGIAPEYQARIFDKFFRVPTGDKHVVKGYGLGLSYVSHIMAQHQGTIRVESEVSQGSTFRITIPMNG